MTCWAAAQAARHSGLRIITEQDDCTAGQASRRSSLFHPGNCEKLVARMAGPGWAVGRGEGWLTPGVVTGVVWQAASRTATEMAIAGTLRRRSEESLVKRFNDIGDRFMLWLILEACAAFFVLVFIVWWTMFSGRKEKNGRPVAKQQKQARETTDSGPR